MNTIVLIALVKMSVSFLHFSFLLFFGISIFSEKFFDRFPKNQKNNKIAKQEEQKTATRKDDAKQKEIQHDDSKQNKTRSRRKTKTKEHLENKEAKTKGKKQEPDTKMKNRKEGSKNNKQERDKEKHKKLPLFGGENSFSSKNKDRETKK